MSKRNGMPWFKHMTDMRNDPKVAQLIDDLGLVGYATWCLVLEVVAEQWKGEGLGGVKMSRSAWGHRLYTNASAATSRLQSLRTLGLIEAEECEERGKVCIEVRVPKLLNYADEWTKRSRVNPEDTRESLQSKHRAHSRPQEIRGKESTPEPLAQEYEPSQAPVQRVSSERPDGPAFRAPAPQPRRRQVLAREKDQWSPPAPEGGALEARVLDAQQQRRQEAQSRLRDEYLMACVQARRRGETPPDEASWREHRLSGESVEVAGVNAEPMAGLENLKANARAKGLDVDGARLTREREERESARKRTGASQATAKAVQPKQEEEFDDPFAD